MKVALVQCPGWGRDCPPYAIALLSAWLRSSGHEAFGFDLNNTLYCSGPAGYRKMWDDKDLYSFWNNRALINGFIKDNERMIGFEVSRILATGSKLVGFTVHFTSLLLSLEVARRIKERDRGVIIVFGGPDCCRELRGWEVIKEDAVDIVAIGEGDETVVDLAGTLEANGKIDFCRGTLLKKDGKVVDCGDRAAIKDLDLAPFPDYSDFHNEILSGHYRQPERLEIFDSRGCIMRCHFCSEWQFWQSYRTMSGERIYEEIAYQVRRFPGVNYFYFIGSLLNGNTKALSKFCDLVIKNSLKIRWAGQAIIRNEMNKELLSKMKSAGCEWLGYGIESGSQRVVESMHKHFSVVNAEEVLRDTHEAQISTQANFMFGIPTETEEDFRQTLEFLKRNRKNMDSVLASQSFCVIDKGTYLHTHAGDFGIRNADHNLYWEMNGNNYAERFRRYEEFCRTALSLGLPETSGVLSVKPDKWALLGDYHLFKKDYLKAIECFTNSMETESVNDSALQKMEECRRGLRLTDKGDPPDNYASLSSGINTDDKPAEGAFCPDEKQRKVIDALTRLGLGEKLRNYLLIESEKLDRREHVLGYPYWLTVDPANFCTLRCPFCPTGQRRGSRTKGKLSLDNFRKVMDKLGPYLIHIDFCNWGEPLLNRDIYEMIKAAKQYRADTKVDSNFNQFSEKDAEDMVLSGLDKLIVSIDGATKETYSKYRVNGDFDRVIGNLKLLIRKRSELKRSNPFISWQFLVFRHNEHEIEQVKKMGSDLGVDSIGVTRAFIGDKEWFPLNEEYSYYKKDKTEDREHTSRYFKPYPEGLCDWPWEALVINPNGSVSACCSVENEEDDFGNILEVPFEGIWNNVKYKESRRYIKNKTAPEGGEKNICAGCSHSGMINPDILSCRSLFGC